ncbi:MAG: ATP-binding protein [Bacteroidales bacterium]|nr:ATP-binding protein [Bacteroidales bacterium]
MGKQEFGNFLKIDFEENPGFKSLFDGDLDPQKICSELEIRTGIDIQPKKSILFFDEIQACPRAIIALRYFFEKMPDLHVVAAGSLLEFVFSEISFPAGRIQTLEIQPMNFSEFLLAAGYAKAAELCNSPVAEVSGAIHEFLTEQLRIYWLVGGMPECVNVYAHSKSIKSATEVQDEIIETFYLDFNKYRPKTDVSCLKAVFSGVAARVGKQIKYTGLANDFTIPTIKKAFESIQLARIATKIKAVSSPGLPVEIHASDKKFKSIFLDIGLMNRVIDIEYNQAFIHRNLLAIYKGQLAEQFVGQEFDAKNKKQQYYWAREAKNSNAEIDFLEIHEEKFIPVEVKDGPSGKLKSLHLFRNQYNPPFSIVFHSGQTGIIKKESIVFLPLYFAGSFAQFGIDPENFMQP